MSRCIVHAGTHKTGTTAIQHILSTSSVELARQGIQYPLSGRRPNHNLIAHTLSTCDDRELKKIQSELYSRYSNAKSIDCMLLSSEEFSTRTCTEFPWQDLKDNYNTRRNLYLSRLKTVLNFFDQIDVFVCFRDHGEYAHALYSTKILSGQISCSFSEFVRHAAPVFNYSNQIALLESLGPVQVRRYESMRHDLGTEFQKWLNIDLKNSQFRVLRKTPPLLFIYWLARAVRAGISEKERKLRASFCLQADTSVIESLSDLSTLWENTDDISYFAGICVTETGLKYAPANLSIIGNDMIPECDQIENLFTNWKSKQKSGLFSFLLRRV